MPFLGTPLICRSAKRMEEHSVGRPARLANTALLTLSQDALSLKTCLHSSLCQLRSQSYRLTTFSQSCGLDGPPPCPSLGCTHPNTPHHPFHTPPLDSDMCAPAPTSAPADDGAPSHQSHRLHACRHRHPHPHTRPLPTSNTICKPAPSLPPTPRHPMHA